MHQMLAKLLSAGPVVTDGAWGTQLQQQGLPVGACPDAWNLTQPDKVEEVARNYVEAGSQAILTNTFGANRFVLARYGLSDQVSEINRAGVKISLRAASIAYQKDNVANSRGLTAPGASPIDSPLSPTPPGAVSSRLEVKVFASMGPSGVMLMLGQVSDSDLKAAFAQQAQALADAGAEGIVIETMSDPAEAALAVAAARETGLPVVACMTFDCGAKQDRTMMGTTPEQAAEQLAAAGADAIGSNCGHGIASMVEVCRRLHAAAERPIWIKANAGLPEVVDGQVVYRQTAAEFAAYVPQLVEAGASFIGGCCGTTPDFIRAVSRCISSSHHGPGAMP